MSFDKVTEDYLSNFGCDYESRPTESSWASEDPSEAVLEKKVDSLDIHTVLALAKSTSEDVDGVVSTGSMRVLNGEEKFVKGACYTGKIGVNVTEISGIDAKFLRGQKVDWLKGNQWRYQEGQWAISEVTVKNASSTTNVLESSKVTVDAGTVTSITKAKNQLLTQKQGDRIVNSDYAGALSLTMKLSPVVVGMNVGHVTVKHNIAVAALNVHQNVAQKSVAFCALAMHTVAFAGMAIRTDSFTPLKISSDHTNLSCNIFTGSKSELILGNKTETIAGNVTKISGAQISALESNVTSLKDDVKDCMNYIETMKSVLRNLEIGVDRYRTFITQGDTNLTTVNKAVQVGLTCHDGSFIHM